MNPVRNSKNFKASPIRKKNSNGVKLKYLTNNPSQTKKLGEILAKEILKTRLQPAHRILPRPRRRPLAKKEAFIIGLEGDLGGGKTTFLQGFAKGLKIKEKILSPSFVLIKKFKVNHRLFNFFYHIDCYRIKKPKELLNLGFKEIISDPKNIVAIEWAERIQKILPAGTITLKFEFIDRKTRKITVGLKNSQ